MSDPTDSRRAPVTITTLVETLDRLRQDLVNADVGIDNFQRRQREMERIKAAIVETEKELSALRGAH